MSKAERAAELAQTGLSYWLAKRAAQHEAGAREATPGNTKEPTTFFNEALKRASLLPDSELRKHAGVSALEGAVRCHDCFCCACWAVLFEREQKKADAERLRRQAEFEARYQNSQAKKAVDRKIWGLE